ncbi:MAG TPA: hypothetical protein VN894_03000 [Polyangiaceae bacterium]|nr:hypothetical protein [Polyangiaceae bacterium]
MKGRCNAMRLTRDRTAHGALRVALMPLSAGLQSVLLCRGD